MYRARPTITPATPLARAVAIPVIASGGVGSDEHVRRAAATRGIAGLIVGKALYEGKVVLADALAIARGA